MDERTREEVISWIEATLSTEDAHEFIGGYIDSRAPIIAEEIAEAISFYLCTELDK